MPKPAVVLILLLAAVLPTVGLSLVVVLCGEWVVQRVRRPAALPIPTDASPPVPTGVSGDVLTAKPEEVES